MKWTMTTPCKLCPFSTRCREGWLGEARAEEIAGGLGQGRGTFPCHETVEYDAEGDPAEGEDTQHCAGALIVLEKEGLPTQMMRIAERLGFYDPDKLKMHAPVFDSLDEFIGHHTEEP